MSFPKVSDSWDAWGEVTFDAVPLAGQDPVVTLSDGAGDTGRVNLGWLAARSSG